MNRMLSWPVLSTLLLVVLASVFFAVKPAIIAKVAVRDDSGPVPAARVHAAGLLKWESGDAITGLDGIANLHFRSFSGVFEVYARKDGYYLPFPPWLITQFSSRRAFYWEPSPTNLEVIIRKIGNPVTMYAKDACAHLGVFGQSRGYDLVIGDWVAPYGSGKSNDLVFEIELEVTLVKTNKTMRLTFSNPGDGIQHYRVPGHGKSRLPIPALAPLSGYRSKWVVGTESKDGENEILKRSEPDEEVHFYFRVRTTTAPDGTVSGGLYGKIYDGISFGIEPDPFGRGCAPGVHFTYFLNPDGTRNTEFSQVNLFTNLTAEESANVNRP